MTAYLVESHHFRFCTRDREKAVLVASEAEGRTWREVSDEELTPIELANFRDAELRKMQARRGG